jgi:hypothetical protein
MRITETHDPHAESGVQRLEASSVAFGGHPRATDAQPIASLVAVYERLNLRIVQCSMWLVAGALLWPAVSARAQLASTRLLASLSTHERRGRTELQIHFGLPVRYLRHSPEREARDLVIEIQPILGSTAEAQDIDLTGTLALPGSEELPVEEVRLSGSPELVRVQVRLREVRRFEVREGDDARSVIVSIESHGPARQDAARAHQLMEAANAALTAGEINRAVLLYTSVIALPETAETPRAMELLGVTRERKGQLAQAVAQYRAYLERYPDSEGSDRVRQRLQALVSIGEAPADPLRRSERAHEAVDYDAFGSVSTYYTRAERIGGGLGDALLDSSQLADVYLTGRLRTPGLEVRQNLAGTYRYDFRTGETRKDARVRELSVELAQRNGPLSAILGRQSRSRGGVLGRFDGIRVDYKMGDFVDLGAVAGFPLDTGFSNRIDTDVVLGGLRLGFAALDDRVSGEVYGIYQARGSATDRAALGGQLQYRGEHGIAVGLLDYDVYFASLNRALFMSNWHLSPEVDVNALAQYGNTPFVTSRSALIASGVGSLADLPGAPATAEIRELALDHTGQTAALAVGGSYRFLPDYRIAVDLNASNYRGTPALGRQDASGFEFSYLAQLTREGLLLENDAHSFGARVFDGDISKQYGLYWLGWLPISTRLQISPRLRADLRTGSSTSDQWSMRPALRFEYRLARLVLDAEVAYQLILLSAAQTSSSDSLYSLDFGIRYEF